jgi:hypothetical protein
MGYLHHSNYFTYFEMGRTELFRASGGNYREMEEARIVPGRHKTGMPLPRPGSLRHDPDNCEVSPRLRRQNRPGPANARLHHRECRMMTFL